jgi:hypothetical protein
MALVAPTPQTPHPKVALPSESQEAGPATLTAPAPTSPQLSVVVT